YLEISFSADARGFVTADPIGTIDPYDPHSLLIPLPRDRPSLVRLARPRQSSTPLVFAAWFSLELPFDTVAPYRNPIHLPGKSVPVRRDDQLLPEPTWLIKPSAGVDFSIKGPARVELVARLPWPAGDPLREQSLEMQLKLDDADPVPLYF